MQLACRVKNQLHAGCKTRVLPTDLKRSRRTPFKLEEPDGVKLDLIFRAVKDLQKRTRIEDIVLGIDIMSREEALYWHSKIQQGSTKGKQNGLRALRMLLGGE